MPPPQRVRYNSAARKSTAGGSSHKKRKGNPSTAASIEAQPAAAPQTVGGGEDDQLDIIERKTNAEKEVDRKERMRLELMEGKEGKMSSKKKKRLEGYIDKKLKKETRLEMFQKLQDMQAEMPSSLLPSLATAATLGSRQLQSYADKAAKLEDKHVRRALKRRRGPVDESASEGDSEEDWEAGKGGPVKPRPVPVFEEEKAEESSAKPSWSGATIVDVTPVVVGGALARGTDGNPVAPVVVKRKAAKGTFASWGIKDKASAAFDEEEDDFDSSDSDMDSDDGDEDEAEGMVMDIPKISGGFGVNPEDDSDEDGSDRDDSEGDEDDSEIDMGSDGMSGEDEEENDAEEQESTDKPKRSGGFKQWALNQMSATYNQSVAAGAPTADEGEASTSQLPVETGPNLKLEALKAEKLRAQQAEIAQGKVGPLGEELMLPSTSLLKPSATLVANKRNHIKVNRDPKIQESRMNLPVVAEEQQIMEAILLNPVIVLCGETGSGKTTQVPQFLFEAGFGSPGSDNPGMIAVTQPRRVAAMSTSLRVAEELNLPSSRVSYQIRYDATTSPQTSIKFMTDGVLLRELARDFLLKNYSVVCVDEAHERGVNTDVLVGVLSRVVKLRENLWREGKEGIRPLRLIIMSATLRTTDFTHNTRLFSTPPPTITIPTRQHPVTVHFNRRTQSDYATEAFNKVAKIHTRLPPGGVLVFLTGQGEIVSMVKKLEKRFGKKAWEERQRQRGLKTSGFSSREKGKGKEREAEVDEAGDMKIASHDADVEIEELDIGEDQADLAEDVDDGADSDPEALDSDSDDEDEIVMNEADAEGPMHILPLYSLLPSDKQLKVFEPPPEGSRLVIIATNVAETSLTIPGIRYVVDTGRAKERYFDPVSGVQSFRVSWISKASASQRAGRAGRTGPGHCYRLYSSPVFENYFEKHAEPEILRMPIEGIVLQMKSMNIDAVVNFPFPTPPDRTSLAKAEKVLALLGALEAPTSVQSAAGKKGIVGGKITELGRAMSTFPVAPRFAKMLVSGQQHGCLPYVIATVAVLAVGDPFLREEALSAADDEDLDAEDFVGDRQAEISHIRNAELRQKEELRQKRKAFFQSQANYNALGNGASDVFRMLAVVGAYEYDGTGERFCAKNYVRPKAMQEIHKLRAQISNIAQANLIAPARAPKPVKGRPAPAPKQTESPLFNPKLTPPSSTQLKVLRQLMASAFVDQLAIRKDVLDPASKAAGATFTSTRGVAYRAMGVDEDVYIHPSSVMFHSEPPEWLVWGDIVRTSQVWMKSVTKINPAWLPSLAPAQFVSFSKPLETPKCKGLANATKLVGKEGEERDTFVIPRFHFAGVGGEGAGAKGIELSVIKRKEVWKGGRWVLQGR